MGFVGDNMRGKVGERKVIAVLEGADIECEMNSDKATNLYHDIACHIGEKEFHVEVKTDYMAQKTGNIAIEYYNSNKDATSGIFATEADIWAHCLKDGDNMTVWITPVEKLKNFVNTETPYKIIERGGDGNAELLIYREHHILDIFTRIDNLMEKDIQKAIRKALKYEK